MGKVAFKAFDIEVFKQGLNLKQIALFFDKVFIDSTFISPFVKDESYILRTESKAERESLQQIIQELQLLYNNGILDMVDVFSNSDSLIDDLAKEGIDQLRPLILNNWHGEHLQSRLGAIALKKKGYSDVFPLLDSESSFNVTGKEHLVMKFILGQLPVPDESISWEQIIDFRKDEDSRLKYYALIKWINEVSLSNKPISHIEDEYQYLYHQYKRQFDLHKMKYNNSTLEIIIGGFFESLTSLQGLSIASGLLKLRTMRVTLLQDEMKFPGSEIAYIHHANRNFE